MKKSIWFVIMFSTLLVILVAMIMPYIPLYGEEIGLPISMIGVVIAIYHLVQVVGRLPMGTLSDYIGYKKVIGMGGASLFLGAVAYVLSSAYWPLIFIAQILFGIAVSITWVTIPAFITQFGQEEIPIYSFGTGWAYTLAVPLGGFIKDVFGMESLFQLAFVLSIPLLLITVLLLKRGHSSKEEARGLSSFSLITVYKKAFETLENPKILRACLFSFLMFMSFTLGFSILPLYLSGLGFSATLIGIVQFSRMGTDSSIRLLSERIENRIGREKILTVGTALVGVSLFIISFLDSLPALIIVSAFWGLSGGLYVPIVFNIIGDATEIENRGTGMGLRGTMGTLGSSVGVLVLSNLADITSTSIALALGGAAIAVSSLGIDIWLNHGYPE